LRPWLLLERIAGKMSLFDDWE